MQPLLRNPVSLSKFKSRGLTVNTMLELHINIVSDLFLPPNTTSTLQPMDAGIIMSFKRHYRRYHMNARTN